MQPERILLPLHQPAELENVLTGVDSNFLPHAERGFGVFCCQIRESIGEAHEPEHDGCEARRLASPRKNKADRPSLLVKHRRKNQPEDTRESFFLRLLAPKLDVQSVQQRESLAEMLGDYFHLLG